MIAVVEDDANIREIEIYTLRSTGFEAAGFADGKSFFAAMAKTRPELLILDVMLPDEDGISILKRLRQDALTRSLPVILATAKSSEYDKVSGLDLGADDYLVKPFGMMEMVSRVKAVLRRTRSGGSGTLSYRGLQMNLDEHTVSIQGRRLELTLKEYEVLRMLLEQPGHVFTRQQLLNDVWGIDYDGETRTVDVHIRTLRAKLGETGDAIETVRGVGYRLEAEQ